MRFRRFNYFAIACAAHIAFCAALLILMWPRHSQTEVQEVEKITPECVEPQDAAQVSTLPAVENEPEPRTPTSTEIIIAKTVWGEARGCSVTEQAAVVWCILNRFDAGYGGVEEIVTAPKQFVGYSAGNPVDPGLLCLVYDVLDRWRLESTNSGEVGRVLPEDYLWFHGDGERNHFRNAYEGGTTWDWSLPSPYGEEVR